MSDFWDEMAGVFATDAIDDHLKGTPLEGEQFTSVRDLAEQDSREGFGLAVPVKAGTRVGFVADLDSVLSYPDIPDQGVEGTVVVVRSAHGDLTSHEGRVFVTWDDGKFRAIRAEHLRFIKSGKRTARSVRMVVSDLDSLAAFFTPAIGSTAQAGDDLVHKATKDLWSFRQEGQNFVIERLFKEDGEPLKV